MRISAALLFVLHCVCAHVCELRAGFYGRECCLMVLLNQKDHEKILSLVSEKNTYEPLKHNSLSGLTKPCTNPCLPEG